MRSSSLNWASLVCFLPLPATAQLAQRPASAPVASDSRTVTLDVVVTDKSGKPVSGLQQQDFTITDNKQQRKIASFHEAAAGDGPVETILFFDAVNTPVAQVAIEQQEIQAFLKRSASQMPGPMTIIVLGQTGIALGPSSARDANAMMAALNQDRSGQLVSGKQMTVYGLDGWQEVSLYTLDQLAEYEAARPGRKLLIWITPGWPLLRADPTSNDPDQGLSSKEQKEMFGTIVALSDKLRQARISIYQIDPSGLADADRLGTSDYKQFEKGAKAANQVQVASLGLQILADQTGGKVLNSSNDMAGEIANCLADARGFYTISFEAPAGDGPNEYHALQIKVDKPGLTARTRQGYYAQP